MTFDEARKRHMERLKKAMDELYGVAADPHWNNTEYKGYKEAARELDKSLAAIRRLNDMEMEAEG